MLSSTRLTFGLAIICADELEEIKKLLETVSQVPFDQKVCAFNGKSKEVSDYLSSNGFEVYPFEWCDDFSKARNFSFSKMSTDVVMWVDSDDSIVNYGELYQTVQNAFSDREVNVLEMPYQYDHDQYGNCIMKLWNSRAVRRGTFKWVGAIHECLLPTQDFKKCRVENVYIKHNVDPSRVKRSGERNLRITKKEYESEKKVGNVDPRTVLYYAKSLDAMGMVQESVPIYEEYIECSEWDDEKYEVLCTLADLHTRSRQYQKSQDYARRAISLRPIYGQAYFELAEVFYRLEKWDDCIHLIKIGLNSKCPVDVIPVDPSEYTLRPYCMLEYALFQTGNPQESLEVIEKALKLQPKNDHLLNRKVTVLQFIARIELERSSIQLLKHLEKTGEQEKIEHLLKALPECVQDHPTFIRLSSGFLSAKGHKNRIVIYCGATFETWSPESVLTTGLGGSEEAVVYLSKELVKLGWLVTVYNNCSKPGVYNGVEYLNFWTHDPKQPSDIFIAWRNSEYVLQANIGSRVFVWLHDRQQLEYWTPERIDQTEKIFVLSKYHRKDLITIPDDKFFITSNGIVPSQFAGASRVLRDPLKCIYASSPDRGLDILLSLWPDIKKSVPDAHLHVFYGFSKTFDMLHKDRESMMKFKENVMELLKQDGVHYHGKVSHAELHDHMMSSGLWLYPTHFTEISCITAMKAQVSGAIPITMTLAALDETVQHGYKISMGISDTRSQKAFTNITIDLLKDPSKQERLRKPMMEWAIKYFAWENVAHEWDNLFRNHSTGCFYSQGPAEVINESI